MPLVGATLSRSDLRDGEGIENYSYLDYEVSWGSTSRDVDSFKVFSVFAGAPPVLLGRFPAGASAQDSLVSSIGDYDGTFGGGSGVRSGWRVRAFDAGGRRVGSIDVGRQPRVVQEDGADPRSSGYARVRVGSDWRVRDCDCASGGRQALTERRGATATVVTRRAAGAASQVALVMGEGPRNSRAVVRVDGRRVAVVDTRAPVRRSRVVTWVAELPAGSVVEVRNRATPGSPRLAFDAVVIG